MIPIERTQHPKARPDQNNLQFGHYFTDHMFLMEYPAGGPWTNGRIVPYAPLQLDPASMVLHYGQEIFEGLKAYRTEKGDTQLFRVQSNIKRFNTSCERLGAPTIPEELFLQAILQTVKADLDWVPSQPDTSLYIRPFLIATDPFLGVHASKSYLFSIILSPVGAYYSGGISPTNILVEAEDVRAVRGGLGFAKTSANYAATIRAQERANAKGFTQVLWLDGIEQRYVEEVGTSNAFFVIDSKVVTPPLQGSILPGITRDSVLQLLAKWGIETEQRPIAIDEVIKAAQENRLSEALASGTAAVISPVGTLTYKEQKVTINDLKIGPLSQRLYDTLTSIQWGKAEDTMGWITKII